MTMRQLHRKPRWSRARRVRLVRTLVVVALLVLAWPGMTYVRAMLQPSSLPLPIRTVEWIRANNGAWLVDLAERYYYTFTAPKTGGPGLTSLPSVGTTVSPGSTLRGAAAYAPSPVPPVIQPGIPGEGQWETTGRSVAGRPPILLTPFRPEADYPQQLAYVAWIDSTRTQLALYPGRTQPPVANPRGPMEVPPGQRARLLATFNSGFTYADSHGGFAINGQTYEPMVDGQGTVVAYADGRVDVVSWQGGPSVPPDVVAARQNLPLIVIDGQPNPALDDTRQWGKTLGNAIRVWRTALGVDARGNLIYMAAPGQTAPSIAAAMIHVGALRAVELDINYFWPAFITYPHQGTSGAVSFVPNARHGASRYLTPDDRDFFAVYIREPGQSLAVPLQ